MIKKREAAKRIVRMGGHELTLTNETKVYWPENGYTKGDVIEYYQTMSRYILPYLKHRPQSLKRNPNGITDRGFYHKDAGDTAPAWVRSTKILSRSTGKTVDYIICNDKATLAYLNNLGCIELNPWHSRTGKLLMPDYFAIDIDPSDKNTFAQVVEVALAVKSVLDEAGARGYCKTSGATGLHIYVPLGARYTYKQAALFAELIASRAHELVPKTTSLVRSLEKRGHKIYIDYLQNSKGQTLSSVYSLRPRPDATASTPLRWSEVKKGLDPRAFTIETLPKRVKRVGDLFNGVLGRGIDLMKCIKELDNS